MSRLTSVIDFLGEIVYSIGDMRLEHEVGGSTPRGRRIRRGIVASVAATGVFLAADRYNPSRVSPTVPTAEASVQPSISQIREASFPRPEDHGGAGFMYEDRAYLEKYFPEIRPDILKPKLSSEYKSDGDKYHRYYLYTDDPYFHEGSLFSAIGIDAAFRQNVDLINGEIDGVRFSANLKEEQEALLIVLPAHAPLPREGNYKELEDTSGFMHSTDPDTGRFIAVVKVQSLEDGKRDQATRVNSLNRTFGAISAAKALDFVGEEVLSDEQQKKVLQALGDVPLARSTGMSYERFAELSVGEYGWAPSVEFYDSVSADIRPPFRTY